jgi:uncharacterized protein
VTQMDVSFPSLAPDRLAIRGTHQGPESSNAVLLVHGITTARDEEGIYARTAEALEQAGLASLRFDFRSHGQSDGTPEQLSISGEVGDLLAAYGWLRERAPRVHVLAASFGAVSTCHAVGCGKVEVASMVLWNPVLDLRRTFLVPETAWARDNFVDGGRSYARPGVFIIDDHFEAPESLLEEMLQYDIMADLSRVEVPVLTIHGDADTYVPYDVSKRFGVPNKTSRFMTIAGAEHGFGRPAEEHEVIDATVAWIKDHTV